MKLEGVDLLDGTGWRQGADLEIAQGEITRISPGQARSDAPVICPMPIDLQVNGGGGWMLGDCEAPGDVLRILSAHRRLGTGAILPTLISDEDDVTDRVISLVAATKAVDDGILGLHLEGPHLAVAGAHDASLLRDMSDADVARYVAARARLGTLMITLAPERAMPEQIARLAEAGIIVALGHSEAGYEAVVAAFKAGARMATHLFNAMSGLHHRAPGFLGAALDRAEYFGLIADGHHVHDAALRLALRARGDAAIPVSDAMATAGTEAAEFDLNGRQIQRRDGRLTLADGTLAGSDISLLQGIRHLARATETPVEKILPMAFDRPHRLLFGTPFELRAGDPARLLRYEDGAFAILDGATWRGLKS